MKILFVVRSAEFFSRYTSILRAISSRGHKITILFNRALSSSSGLRAIEQFKNQNKNVSYEDTLLLRRDLKRVVLIIARQLWTYRRFLLISDQSSFFKDRWRRRHMIPLLRFLISLPFAEAILKTKFVGRLFRRIEAVIPPDKKIIAHIKYLQPEVMVIPIIGMRVMSPPVEYLKAANSLGIPIAAPTPSWDSITTKSSMTVFPDIFLLWNEFHRKRIEEHHGVPPEKVRLIGAHRFDEWFDDWKPSCSRAEFCAKYGIPVGVPYVLYLGSAVGSARNETWLIREFREWLNKSESPTLRSLHIVVRPHPSNSAIYDDFVVDGVTVLPDKSVPAEIRSSRQLSFDTFHYAAAVIGIFTSAMMEAHIMDRPVIVFLTGAYRETQTDAQHFRDFVAIGSVDLARSFREFGSLIEKVLEGRDNKKEKRKEFVKTCIRPMGLEKSAGDLAADEIEKFAGNKAQ